MTAWQRWMIGTFTTLLIASHSANAQMVRISEAADGTEANDDSYEAAISFDGSVIAFQSNATNLVLDDTNNSGDIFVHDLNTDIVERVSLDQNGAEIGNGRFNNNVRTSISDDGNRIAFQSYGLTGYSFVLVRDRTLANTTVVLPPSSFRNQDREARQEPALSGDGQFVAFHSLVTFQNSEPVSARPIDDDLNGVHDIFVYDLNTQPVPQTDRISRDASGVEGRGDSYSPSVSDNGRFVAFDSVADNFIVNDNNVERDIYVKDRNTGDIERVSISSAGAEANGESFQAKITSDGRFVAFRSRASNLVNDDNNQNWDIFVHDRTNDTTDRVSIASDGTEASHGSFSPAISDDGRYVVFRSNANNLVEDDTNQRFDIFVHDRNTAQTVRISTASDGTQADGHSYRPDISGDGNWIVFESDATNLVAGDTNRARDIFRVANPL